MFRLLVILCLLFAEVFCAATFTNPIKKTDGSDPYIVGSFHWHNVDIRTD
jgi:hypothetical protein